MPALRAGALPVSPRRPNTVIGRAGGRRDARPQRVLTPDQRKKAAKANLHYGQTQAWLARQRDEYRIISLFAGTGGGKTWFGPRFWYPEIRKKPQATYLFVEPTWRLVKRIMVPMIEEFFGAYNLGRMHYGDMAYELYSGGRILFGSVDNPNSLQGVHIDGGIWGDEIGLYAEEAWDVLLQRSALFNAPILATSTPYTLPWCEKRLSLPAEESKRRGDKEYWIIQFPSYWNPMYPRDQYFRLKRTWPRDKFDRLMRGLFTRIGGLMFEEIKEDRNLCEIWPIEGTREFPYRIAIRHPKEGQREVNLVKTWAAQDWGWNDAGCQLLFGMDGMGRTYVIEEDYDSMIPVERGTDRGEDTWTARALRRVERWGIEVLWADPSMPGYITDMRSHGIPAMPANNKVKFGTERVNQAMQPHGDGSAGCYIATNGCPNLVRTYGSYVRKKGRADDEYLDEPADGQEDHACDTLRYGLTGDAKPEDRDVPGDVPGLILSFSGPNRSGRR
jgi:hypothetical protein